MTTTPSILTQSAREAAQDAGRRLVGDWAPDVLRESMAEVALAGAIAALAVQPVAPGVPRVPQRVRDAAQQRTTRTSWGHGSRILYGHSTVEDRTFARECVNYVLLLLEAEGPVPENRNQHGLTQAYGPSGTTP